MPRIFSLSTVGVRCHYHQNYPFNEERTDFVGDNGVGKSIIADLFQLMFVTERSSIEFGTEGVDEERRQLHTIPYKSSVAYAFLNIEVKKEQYISIGVQISNKESVPLKLFLVIENLNLNSSIDECTYNQTSLLGFEDFIYEDQSVLEPDILAKKLRNDKKLIIHFFKDKGQKNEYYQWLYSNHIFPINLSEKANLKAFSKVIQSFSRAKTLNVKKPEQLKGFLFDDSEKEIFKEFDNSKDQLTNLLNDYRVLSEEIKDLEKKQKVLLELKKLEETQQKSLKVYLGNNLAEKNKSFKRTNEDLKSAERQLQGLERSLDENIVLRDKLELEVLSVNKRHKEAMLNFTNLYEYKNLNSDLLLQKSELNNLTNSLNTATKKGESSFTILTSLQEDLELTKKEISQINDRIPALREDEERTRELSTTLKIISPIISTYKSMKEIMKAFDNQENKIYNLLQEKSKKLSEYQLLNKIMDDKLGKDTLFQWAIDQGIELSQEQESILFEYKDILTHKPQENDSEDSYTLEPIEFLSNKYHNKGLNNRGVWLKLGKLNKLVPLRDQLYFSSDKSAKEIVKKRKEEVIELINETKLEIQKINRLRTGELDNNEILLSYNLDKELLNYHAIELVQIHFSEHNRREQIFEEADVIKKQLEQVLEERGRVSNKKDSLFVEIQATENAIQDYKDKKEKAKREISLKNAAIAKSESNLIELKSNLPQNIDLGHIDREIDTWKTKSEELLNGKSNLNKQSEDLIQKISNIEPQISSFKDARIPDLEELLELKSDELDDAQEAWAKFFNEEIEEVLDGNVVGIGQDVGNLKFEFEENKRKYSNSYSKICYSGEFKETNLGENVRLKIQIDSETFSFKELEQVLLGRIKTTDQIIPDLKRANAERDKIKESIITRMVKVFSKTQTEFERHRDIVRDLNHFFLEKKISNKYEFKIEFENRGKYDISWIDKMLANRHSYQTDLFGQSNSDGVLAEEFLVDFYNNEIKGTKAKTVSELLNPKSYFTLNVSLKDSKGNSLPGSGGESYASLVLLCIGRLSKVQRKPHEGIRFIILEETASLDDTNFGIFPEIAKVFGYQLITMTPKPFAVGTDSGWYLHHLIKGKDDDYINHYPPASYFRTVGSNQKLKEYLARNNN